MSRFSLSHLADPELMRDVRVVSSRHQDSTAVLLAQLAEVDVRKLYLPAGYPSMFAWCVGELGMSEDAAFRRIRAARTAREFPVLFAELASGRLNLSTVLLLTPHLTRANADELIASAACKARSEIEQLLAERFPQPDMPTTVRSVAGDTRQLAPAPVAGMVKPLACNEPPAPPARLTPLGPERFALQVTVPQATHDKMRYAQALLGHAVPSGDLSQVLDHALDALIARLEQRKFAACARSRPARGTRTPRAIPAAVRREVWQRDGGRCTFVSAAGHRCESRTRLEFDHAKPAACGGTASAENLRLRCRAHNQHAAEQAFGAGFMREKRDAARRDAAARREAAEARREVERKAAAARCEVEAAARARAEELMPWLRTLGFRRDEAQRGAAVGAALAEAPLAAQLKAALRSLAPASARARGDCAR